MADNAALIFRVTRESDGGYCAECLSEPILHKATHGRIGSHDIKMPSTVIFSMIRDPDPFALASVSLPAKNPLPFLNHGDAVRLDPSPAPSPATALRSERASLRLVRLQSGIDRRIQSNSVAMIQEG